jgi:hypothetical protein
MNKKKLIRLFLDMKRDGMAKANQFGINGGLAFTRMMSGAISVEDYVKTYFGIL